jgi:hypothetical protein
MNDTKPITIFIGYDERQPETYDICRRSLLDTSSGPLEIVKLHHKILRERGIFKREWRILANGQYEDAVDGKPFSTQFSHTRFLVPFLSQGKSKYSIFVDSDFVFREDVYKLIQHCAGGVTKYPVYVVKHEYKPLKETKMDGMKQVAYNRKLWTSLMVFDNSDPILQNLSVENVNTKDGSWLHQFGWLGSNPDDNIGSIPEVWNFIPDHSEGRVINDVPHAIHYTEGTPHMHGYEESAYSDLYFNVYKKVLKEKLEELSENN